MSPWVGVTTYIPAFGFFVILTLQMALGVDNPPPPAQVFSWQQALELALKYNPKVQIRFEQLEEVEGRIVTEKANFLPTVSANGQSTAPTVNVNLSVPLYTAARAPAFAAFPIARKAAWANAQLALIEMGYQLRLDYILAYYDQQLVPVAQEELDLLEKRIAQAPSLFQAGRMSKADLEALDVREALAKSKLSKARIVAETSRLNLMEVVGLRPSDPRLQGALITDFKDYANLETDEKKLVATAMAQRQDLQLLREVQHLDDLLVRVDAAQYYPEVRANLGFQNNFQPPGTFSSVYHALDPRNNPNNLDDTNERQALGSLGMQAQWSLYNGGVTQENVNLAKIQPIKIEIQLQQITDQIPRQVELALNVLKGTERVIQSLQTEQNPERNLHDVQEAFRIGHVTQVEVLDAQEEYILYKENLLLLESGHEQALAALDRLLGQTFRVEVTIP